MRIIGQSAISAIRATTGRLSFSITGRARMLRKVRLGIDMRGTSERESIAPFRF